MQRIFLVLLATAACNLPVYVSAADPPERVSVTTYEKSNAAWTRGSIELVSKTGDRSLLELNFSMPRGKIERMTVKSQNWQSDITVTVAGLANPYPLRSQVWIHKISGKGAIGDAALLIPFADEGGQCQVMRIHFVDGKLAESGASRASDAQCEP